ncbi:MAG: hypothetical protein ABIX28_02895 [Vicinamibacterales bacterium]
MPRSDLPIAGSPDGDGPRPALTGSAESSTISPHRPLVPVSIALALACLGPTTSGATASLGRIDGVIRLAIAQRAALPSGAYAARTVTRPVLRPGTTADVVVFIRDIAGAGLLPVTHTSIVQRDESFEPRVVAITRGSTVDVPNADPFFHNVFSLSSGAAFDLGQYKRGDSRTRVFTHAGLVKVYCHVHSQMSASILVLDNDYFTRPQADGRFTLEDVPAGTFRVSAWQERLGETVTSVVVKPGLTTHLEFNLPLDQP